MDREGRMEKKNKTLGTERCENIDTLYINKIIIIITTLFKKCEYKGGTVKQAGTERKGLGCEM